MYMARILNFMLNIPSGASAAAAAGNIAGNSACYKELQGKKRMYTEKLIIRLNGKKQWGRRKGQGKKGLCEIK